MSFSIYRVLRLGIEVLRPEINNIVDKTQIVLSDVSDESLQAKTLLNIALTYSVLGDNDKFEKFLNKALKRAKKLVPSPLASIAYLEVIMGLIDFKKDRYLDDVIDEFLVSLAVTGDSEAIRDVFELYMDFLSESGRNVLIAESAISLYGIVEEELDELKRRTYEEIRTSLDYESQFYAKREVERKIEEFKEEIKKLIIKSLVLAFRELIERGDAEKIEELYSMAEAKIRFGPAILAKIAGIAARIRRGDMEIPENVLKEIKEMCDHHFFRAGVEEISEHIVNAFKEFTLKKPESLKKVLKKIGNDFMRSLILIGASEAYMANNDAKQAEKFLSEARSKVTSDDKFGVNAKDRVLGIIFDRALRNKMFKLAFESCSDINDMDDRMDNFLELCSKCDDPKIVENAKKRVFSIIDSNDPIDRYGLYIDLLEEHRDILNEKDVQRVLQKIKDSIKKISLKDWEKVYMIGNLLIFAIRFNQTNMIKDAEKWLEKATKKDPKSPEFHLKKEVILAKLVHAKGESAEEIANHIQKALQVLPELEYDADYLEMIAGALLNIYNEREDRDLLKPTIGKLIDMLARAKKSGAEVDSLYEDLVVLLPNLELHEFMPHLLTTAPLDVLDSEDTIDALVDALEKNMGGVLEKLYESGKPIHKALTKIATIRYNVRKEKFETIIPDLKETIELAENTRSDRATGIILYRVFQSLLV